MALPKEIQDKIYVMLTGTEDPQFMTARERVMVDKFAEILGDKNVEIELLQTKQRIAADALKKIYGDLIK